MSAAANKQTVAYIGLGRMGLGMATNVLKAGFALVVWNRTPQKADSLVRSGATLAKSPAEAASRADVVVSNLTDDEAVLSVTTGRQGLLAGLKPSAIHVGASTISPGLSDKLERLHRKSSTHYIAGPVLGRPPAAAAGQLMTFLAGDAASIERARPVVASYAPTITVVGERPRLANISKLLANFTLVSALDLTGQTLALAEKSKLDPRLAIQMLIRFFGVPAVQEYVTRIAERDFDNVGFDIATGLKDVELMIAAGQEAGVNLTNAQAVRVKMRTAMRSGLRGKDWCSFTEVDRR